MYNIQNVVVFPPDKLSKQNKKIIAHTAQKMKCTKLYLASVLCKLMLSLKRSQEDLRNHSLFLV